MFKKGNTSKTLKDITSSISEIELLGYYFDIVQLPALICSPLRKDTKPSFGLFCNSDNKVYYRDFANGDTGNLYTLLGKLWNCSYDKVIERIVQDTHSNTEKVRTISKSVKSDKRQSQSEISVKIRDWKQHDFEYWESYGISKKWLEFGRVYPISHIFITKGKERSCFPAEKYAYVYVEFKDNNPTFKVYQPFSERYKWMSKHDSSVWDLWQQLPKSGDKLIITSSRKDALAIWENTGIPATSLQGEGYLPKPQVIEELKSRFKEIFVLFDNDYNASENHGRLYGEHFSKMCGLKQIEIPNSYHSKDSSDVVKNHNRKTLREIILSLTNSNH